MAPRAKVKFPAKLEIAQKTSRAPAAIHAKCLPCDVAAFGSGKEKHCMGYFLDRSSSPQRNVTKKSIDTIFLHCMFTVKKLLGALGEGRTRSHTIYQDSVLA